MSIFWDQNVEYMTLFDISYWIFILCLLLSFLWLVAKRWEIRENPESARRILLR